MLHQATASVSPRAVNPAPSLANAPARFSAILALALGLLGGAAIAQDAIPLDRLPPGGKWRPGIPGGIPTVTSGIVNVKEAPYYAKGDGVTDDRAAIEAALNSTASVVYLPAGTYLVTDGIRFPLPARNKILRGAGPSKTRIVSSSAVNIITISSLFGISGWTPLTAPAARGATQITVTDTSKFTVGMYVLLDMTNDPADALPSYMGNAEGQYLKIVSKDATRITFDSPLYIDYPLSRSPRISAFLAGAARRSGIEDLSVERRSATGLHNIVIAGAEECWVRNVESIKANKWHIRFEDAARCEVRQCLIWDGWNGGGDSSYGVGLFDHGTEHLIEDNVFHLLRHSMIIEYGGQGNVFGYNYSFNPINEGSINTDYLMGDQILHGGLPQFNLFEGNVAATIKFDNVLGGSSHNMVFRSLIQRKGLPSTYVACFAGDIQRANHFSSIVGCVYERPPEKNPSNPEYRFGSTGDNSTDPDPLSFSTAYLHGIYSMQTGLTNWVSTNPTRTLPASLYRSGPLEGWPATLPWPAIGPDLANKVGGNPAYVRWKAGLPSGVTVLPAGNLRVAAASPSSSTAPSELPQPALEQALGATPSESADPESIPPQPGGGED